MRSGALADPAKVDPQRYQSRIIQSDGCAKHDLVVHRSAAERMRMQDHGKWRARLRAVVIAPLQAALGAGEYDLWHRLDLSQSGYLIAGSVITY